MNSRGPIARRELLLGCSACLALVASAGCKNSTPSSCNDTSKLAPDDITARNAVAYLDVSPEPGKLCLKCIQYIAAPSTDQCASCKVIKGPIHPNGWCRVYVPA